MATENSVHKRKKGHDYERKKNQSRRFKDDVNVIQFYCIRLPNKGEAKSYS